ncbi:15754_t:CDS:2 [Rhizophagus irregularis]|nr:15754_t:CDS:2 [Rhizophagus irregularis]
MRHLENEEEKEDDDAEIQHQQLKRNWALKIWCQEEERLKALEEEEKAQTTKAEEEEEESESETDSEKEEQTSRKLLKPVFIPKAHRETGSFYLKEHDEILKHNYTLSTLDEVAHREILPKVMQVKNFGHVGQTKWTHLMDQDTLVKDAPWNAKTEINKRTLSKLSSLHGGFDKPIAKKSQ